MDQSQANALTAIQFFQPLTDYGNRLANLRALQDQRAFEQQQQERQFQQQQSLQQANFGQQTQLENLRTANQRDLATMTLDRQLEVSKQAQTAKDTADLNKQFALSYPIYARAAATIGTKPKPLAEYDTTWEGLAQLQADMSDVGEKAKKKDQTEQAQTFVLLAKQQAKNLARAIKARDDASKFSDTDYQFIHGQGLKSLQSAVDTGAISGVSTDSDKWKAILTALQKPTPDLAVVQQLAGPQALAAYNQGVNNGVLAIRNDKDKIAERQAATRDVQAAEKAAGDLYTRLLTVSASNPETAGVLGPALQSLQGASDQAAAPAPATPDITQLFLQKIGQPNPATPVPQSGVPTPSPVSQATPFTPPNGLGALGNSILPSLLSLASRRPAFGGAPAQASTPSPSPVLPAPFPRGGPLDPQAPFIPQQAPFQSLFRPGPVSAPSLDPNAPFVPYRGGTELDNLRALLQSQPAGQAPITPNAPLDAMRANPNFLQDYQTPD